MSEAVNLPSEYQLHHLSPVIGTDVLGININDIDDNTVRWQPDSFAFWDNRAAQHYAAADYWPEVRTMERVTIVGDEPV